MPPSKATNARPTRSAARAAPASKPAAAKAKAANAGKSAQAAGSASDLIDAKIAQLNDWRGKMLARLRALIKEADPAITEEWKWDVPVWSHDGIVCTGETYAKVVKLTFAKGASLPDPKRLFNSSLEGSTRRAIDIREGEEIDKAAFQALVKAAVDHNGLTAKATKAKTAKKR